VKLIYCPECHDVRKLHLNETVTCQCGQSSGAYVDNLNAWISGKAIPIGFANPTLVDALYLQELYGDRSDRLGHRFEAFIIPDCAPTVTRKTPE
jgi:hypothetical protein